MFINKGGINNFHTNVPSLTDESKSLNEAYKCWYSGSPFDDGTVEYGNTLLDKMREKKGRDGRKLSRPPI